MRTLLIGQHHPIDHPTGSGRWWSLQTLYAYSLLCDPFILCRTGTLPSLFSEAESIEMARSRDMLVYAHPTPGEHARVIDRALCTGDGGALINAVTPQLLANARSLRWLQPEGSPFRSLCERWTLGDRAQRSYHFDDLQQVLCIPERQDQTVLSRIGDRPGFIVKGRTAVMAADYWSVAMRYVNTSFFDTLLLDIASLLVDAFAVMFNWAISTEEWQHLARNRELRRDFHAFGFAALTVQELARCHATGNIDVSEASRTAIEAARVLARGEEGKAELMLRSAFELLARENARLQPSAAIFTDTLHAGGLFSNIGYCEFDWPQHAADVLTKHLDWAETRGYRFNLDFAATSVEQLARRFPILFDRLRRAQEDGLVEWVNGTFNQPYAPFHSLESQLRQFDYGQETFARVVGRAPVVFASQEFALAPQLASILAMRGFAGAVLRVQNGGDAPTPAEEMIAWQAPNGDQLPALPSHPYKSEKRNEVTYNNLHLKIYASQQSGQRRGVFSGLGDLTYYRPFREELARAAHYANIFGTFRTWSQYFASDPAVGTCRSFTLEDFECSAAFIDPASGEANKRGAGKYNAHCMRSIRAAQRFAAAETLDALLCAYGVGESRQGVHDRCWKALAVYEGHDVHIAANYPAGAFMSGVSRLSTGRSSPTVADYCGPFSTQTIGERATGCLVRAQRKARALVRSRLRTLVESTGESQEGARTFAAFNAAPARKTLVRIPRAAGLHIWQNGQVLSSQNAGPDLLTMANMPAYGCVFLHVGTREAADQSSAVNGPPVRVGDNVIDNGLLRVEFNPREGAIRLIRASDGTALLDDDSHRFYVGPEDRQRCAGVRWLCKGPLKAEVELTIEIGDGIRSPCVIRTRMSLVAGQRHVTFRTRVVRCPRIEGDAWLKHLGVHFTVAGAAAAAAAEYHRCHFNVLEPSRAERLFSPYLLLARAAMGEISFMNCGNQFYLRKGNVVSHILRCENESATRFTYAVGLDIPNPLAYAMRWKAPCDMTELKPHISPGNVVSLVDRSLMDVAPAEVVITSVSRRAGNLVVRLANTSPNAVDGTLDLAAPVELARQRAGNALRSLQVRDGRVWIPLRPWDIVEVVVGVRTSPMSAKTKHLACKISEMEHNAVAR